MIGAAVLRGLRQDGFAVDWVQRRPRRRVGTRGRRARGPAAGPGAPPQAGARRACRDAPARRRAAGADHHGAGRDRGPCRRARRGRRRLRRQAVRPGRARRPRPRPRPAPRRSGAAEARHGGIELDPATRDVTRRRRARPAVAARVRAARGVADAARRRALAGATRGQALRLERGGGEQRRRGAPPRAAPQARRRRDPQRSRRGLDAREPRPGDMRETRTFDPAQLTLWLAAGLALAPSWRRRATYLRARDEANALFDFHLRQTRPRSRACRSRAPARAPASATKASSCRSGTPRRATVPLATRRQGRVAHTRPQQSRLRDDRHAVGALPRIQRPRGRPAGAGGTTARVAQRARRQARGLDDAAACNPRALLWAGGVALPAPRPRAARAGAPRPCRSAHPASSSRWRRPAGPARWCRWSTRSTGCSAGCRAPSTRNARSSRMRRTSCARRSPRWDCRRSSPSAPGTTPTGRRRWPNCAVASPARPAWSSSCSTFAREEPGVSERPFARWRSRTIARHVVADVRPARRGEVDRPRRRARPTT